MKNILLPGVLCLVIVLCSCTQNIKKKDSTPVSATVTFESRSLDDQLNNLTQQLISSLNQMKKNKIAIMEFPDLHGRISEFGKFIPEELTTRLFMTRRFEVVERQLLNKVLEEQNLGMTGILDESSAARIGKILGVDAIVTGSITDLGNVVRINSRLIATETASVFAVSSVSIDKNEGITTMLGKYADSSTKPVSTSSVSPSTPKPSSSGREESQSLGRAKVEDIEFEIITCTLTADQRLVLEIMILNQGKVDKEFSILNSSILYDNFGQEYKNAIREIGSKKAEGFVGQL
ncbi:MAG: FlgO family outer membrane protein, partial [Candidatus Cloacimonetes bacterium]|nr:FlgO family outer membrane protein [Candidatus Cloacimonadota bacterium]